MVSSFVLSFASPLFVAIRSDTLFVTIALCNVNAQDEEGKGHEDHKKKVSVHDFLAESPCATPAPS